VSWAHGTHPLAASIASTRLATEASSATAAAAFVRCAHAHFLSKGIHRFTANVEFSETRQRLNLSHERRFQTNLHLRHAHGRHRRSPRSLSGCLWRKKVALHRQLVRSHLRSLNQSRCWSQHCVVDGTLASLQYRPTAPRCVVKISNCVGSEYPLWSCWWHLLRLVDF